MSRPEQFERVGVVVGCGLLAVFVVSLLADLAAQSVSRSSFTVAVLAFGVGAGVVVAYYQFVAYETVWAFALGAWVAAVPLVALAAEGRILVLIALDTYLQPETYRVVVLALSGVAGALVATLYDRYA